MTPLDAALIAIDEFHPADADQEIIKAKCRGLMIGYASRWNDTGWLTHSVEEVFQLPLVNPETGRASKTFQQAGKFDGIVEHSGKRYLLEHKTTSEDITDPNAAYFRRLVIDSQVSGYVLAKWQQGLKLDGTLYDVIRKPGIRPKEIPRADLQQILQTRTYFGYEVSVETQNRLATEIKPRECGELYAMRLAAETLENPDKYFQRRVIPRLDSDITEYAQELWDVSQSILDARRKEAHYRNSGACMDWGSPCRFLGICSGYDSPDSERWKVAPNVHDELPIVDGRDVLTNSRVKTFQTCRRKHYLHYELGIRRVDDEDKEALVLGSLLHKGLEAYWSQLKGTQDDYSETAAVCTEQATATAGSQAELLGGGEN